MTRKRVYFEVWGSSARSLYIPAWANREVGSPRSPAGDVAAAIAQRNRLIAINVQPQGDGVYQVTLGRRLSQHGAYSVQAELMFRVTD